MTDDNSSSADFSDKSMSEYMDYVYVDNSDKKDQTKFIIVGVLLLIYASFIMYIAVYHPDLFDSKGQQK